MRLRRGLGVSVFGVIGTSDALLLSVTCSHGAYQCSPQSVKKWSTLVPNLLLGLMVVILRATSSHSEPHGYGKTNDPQHFETLKI